MRKTCLCVLINNIKNVRKYPERADGRIDTIFMQNKLLNADSQNLSTQNIKKLKNF